MRRVGPATALTGALPSMPRTIARTAPRCPRIGGPGYAHPPRTVVLVQAQRQKKADQEPASYSDVLLQREQQLWDRQVALAEAAARDARANYETLLAAHGALQEQLAAERAAAERREDALRKENAELRSQVMYAAAQLAAAGASERRGGVAVGGDADVLDGRGAAAHLPSSVPPPQPAESAPAAPVAAASGGFSAPAAAAAAAAAGAPSWASEIEAAMAAVDEVDILTHDVDYAAMAQAKQQQQAAAAAAAAPPPPAPETPPAPEEAPAPSVPPPTLVLGADDIFWVNQLHTALADAGYFPGDEDIDDFFFGESTLSAVMTMQACEGLPETGAVDAATWAALLGADLQLKPSRDLAADQMAPNMPGVTTPGRKPFAELFSASSEAAVAVGADGALQAASSRTTLTETDVYADGRVVEDSVTVTQRAAPAPGGGVRVETAAAASHRETPAPAKWPVLIEGDGSKEVHALHVLLDAAGYYPGEEDERWWQFGDTTAAALKTFQACSGLPESGACDAATWVALLGPGATPSDLANVRSGASDDEDLADDGGGTRVWLMGEQRWEDRSKLG